MSLLFNRDKSTISRYNRKSFIYNKSQKEAVSAKNYLNENESPATRKIVSVYLDFAELQVEKQQVITIQN